MANGHTPAQRGWIAVATTYRRGYTMHTGAFTSMRINVGTVTNVTRDGLVKRFQPAHEGQAPMTRRDWTEIVVLDPAKRADPDAFLAECATRQTTDPEHYNPWRDVNDVREVARKYRA